MVWQKHVHDYVYLCVYHIFIILFEIIYVIL